MAVAVAVGVGVAVSVAVGVGVSVGVGVGVGLGVGVGWLALGGYWRPARTLAVVAAAGALIGHLYPVWLKFRGGKGAATLVGTVLVLAPVALVVATLGTGHVLFDIAAFFSKLAVVSFGGAYALLAYMAQQAVETYGWMSAPEMVDGLGFAATNAICGAVTRSS